MNLFKAIALLLVGHCASYATTITGNIRDVSNAPYSSTRIEFQPISSPSSSNTAVIIGVSRNVAAPRGELSVVLTEGWYNTMFHPTTNKVTIYVPASGSYTLAELSTNFVNVWPGYYYLPGTGVTFSTNDYAVTITSSGSGTTYTNNSTGLPGVIVGSGIGTNIHAFGALTNNESRNVNLEGNLYFGGVSTPSVEINASSGEAVFDGAVTALSFSGGGTGLTAIPDAAVASTITRDTELTAANTVVSNGVVTGLAAGSYPIDGVALEFSELYSAWVSKYGDNSTGTVGKRERPFANVSNAVYAVKSSLGSANTNGVVYIGAGLFDEHLVNLQRTNLSGISLVGQGTATFLTARSTHQLTNLGALVIPGNNSRVVGVCISNDMAANFKQAAIGYDATLSAATLGTLVVPTNVFINVPIGRGSSDIGYFFDNGGGDASITLHGCDWVSRWDALFVSSLSTDMDWDIRNSSIRVLQTDGYNFPGGGSGDGRARAIYISDGRLNIENSLVMAIGSNVTTNETTALSFFGSTVGYTNVGSFIDAASSGSGAVTLEFTSEPTQYRGKIHATQITGAFSSITNSGKYNGVKVYRATLTQSGTAAPTASILENSLGATPTWARSGIGVYTLDSSSLFTSAKTQVRFAISGASGFQLGTYEWTSSSQIIFRTVDDVQVGGLSDDQITAGSCIEILVYP